MTSAARVMLFKHGLSDREIEVASLVSRGLTNKEVAKQIEVTEKTVKYHLTNVYKKMGLRGRMELMRFVITEGQG